MVVIGDKYKVLDHEEGFGRVLFIRSEWSDDYADIIEENNIDILRLNDTCGWPGENVDFIRKFPQLRGLEINGPNIKDVSAILEHRKLEVLSLFCDPRISLDFSRLTNLRVCKIDWTPGVKNLFELYSLEYLNIDRFPGRDFSELGKLTNITNLYVPSSGKLESTRGIQKMKLLKVLHISYCRSLSSLDGLESIVELEKLYFRCCKKLFDFGAIKSKKILRSINIDNCGEINTLRGLATCASLEYVSFVEDTNVIDGDIGVLLCLPVLQDVRCRNRPHYSHSREEIWELIARRRQ